MARKSHTNTAKPCQITPKLPFAVEPYHDLLTPAQERALIRATAQPGGSEIGDGRSGHTWQLQPQRPASANSSGWQEPKARN
jgi:hypothetical protein